MKVSIVTSVLNRANTIADTIESVRQQTYCSIEHIIQDGGSTDGTIDVISRAASPAIQFITQQDAGIYDGINRGIQRASGDIIGLLHSDDVFAHSRVIEKIAQAFEDPTIDGVYGDLEYVSSRDLTRVIRHWRSQPYSRDQIRSGWMPPHPTLYLRRKIYETYGLYDPKFQIAADYDAMLRYLVKGEIQLSYIPEVLVKMRMGGESNQSLSRILRKTYEDYLALRRNDAGGMRALILKNVRKLPQFLP